MDNAVDDVQHGLNFANESLPVGALRPGYEHRRRCAHKGEGQHLLAGLCSRHPPRKKK